MQTNLVVGGAGFIGSHICKKLLEKDKVICVDNLITGSKKNIEPFLQEPNFEFINLDVTKDISTLNSQFSTLNYIFHLASPASPNERSPRSYVNYPLETLLVNSYGTYQLLELAKEKKARFLFASTSEVYGDSKESPQKETYFGNVNPNGVRSVYDESKRFGEAMSMNYYRKNKMDVRVVRIFNTYGGNMQKDDGRVISNFINQALANKPITVYGNGEQTRSFCFIDDMTQGILSAMLTDGIAGEVINLGNPEEYSIIDIAHKIKELTKSNSEIVFEQMPQDDPKKRRPDTSKAMRLLKWSPYVQLEDGLKRTIEYFKNVS